MLPKLYEITHPSTPWQVVYSGPSGKRVRRHFSKKADAEAYHRDLLAKAQIAGTAGLVMDAEMRAEYFAARQILAGVPLLDAVRYYVRHNPVGDANVPLAGVVDDFIEDKRRAGRSENTIRDLESRLRVFMAGSSVTQARDFTAEAVRRYLQALPGGPVTLRNHRACLSVFGGWLARKRIIPENPVRDVERVRYDQAVPAVLTPQDAEKVMRKAQEHRGGIFALYFALTLFAGLRSGEVERLTWSSIHLDGASPVIRVAAGKKRGRRAIRIVPIEPALKSWLEWGREKGVPIAHQPINRAQKVRDVIDWQPDIARHSWISYRLALVANEAEVARQAGNTPDVIYRHYYQLVTRSGAVRFFSIWPDG